MPTVLSSRDYGIVFQRVDDSNRIDHVPAHVYTLTLLGNPMEGLELALLKDRKNFNTPERLYGDNADYVNMFYDDWRSSEGATGVMLVGKKGCGKTVLAEAVANKILAADVPVFLISTKIPVAMIKSALAACPNGAMVFFDEFEKTYAEEEQTELLGLFSDSGLNKVLFVMTVNDSTEINDYLINRPGRIKYWIQYHGVEDSVVVELMETMKVPMVLRSAIREWAHDTSTDVSFDIIKFVCKEALLCSTWEQFVKRVKVLNLPAMFHHDYVLANAVVKGHICHRENVTFEMIGYRSFSIAIKCKESGVDIYEEFDVQCHTDGTYSSIVNLPGDITLDIIRRNQPYVATSDRSTNKLDAKPVPVEVAQEPVGKDRLLVGNSMQSTEPKKESLA